MTADWSMSFTLQQTPPPEQAPPPTRSPGSFLLIQMLLIFGIVYFLILRPKITQERAHRERVSQLKKGDEVVTSGGIVGEIVHIKDDRVTVKSGESRFVIMRDRIADIPSMREAKDATAK